MVKIQIDHENNAETFWDLLNTDFPEISNAFDESDTIEVTQKQWEAIQSLDGFCDGPEYAPTAIVEV